MTTNPDGFTPVTGETTEAPDLPARDSDDIALFAMLADAVADEAHAVECPWLIVDFDFVRMTLEACFGDTLAPAAIADAAARIVELAAE